MKRLLSELRQIPPGRDAEEVAHDVGADQVRFPREIVDVVGGLDRQGLDGNGVCAHIVGKMNYI